MFTLFLHFLFMFPRLLFPVHLDDFNPASRQLSLFLLHVYFTYVPVSNACTELSSCFLFTSPLFLFHEQIAPSLLLVYSHCSCFLDMFFHPAFSALLLFLLPVSVHFFSCSLSIPSLFVFVSSCFLCICLSLTSFSPCFCVYLLCLKG